MFDIWCILYTLQEKMMMLMWCKNGERFNNQAPSHKKKLKLKKSNQVFE